MSCPPDVYADMPANELLAFVIGGEDGARLADDLLRHAGNVAQLARLEPLALPVAIPGLTTANALAVVAACRLAPHVSKGDAAPYLTSPSDVARLLRDRCACYEREHLFAMPLDRKMRLLGEPRRISMGTLDQTLVHPREVFRPAICAAAAFMMLAHNHPSGDATPSMEDIRATRELVAAGNTLGIQVLDHVVIGRPDHYSMLENGVVQFNDSVRLRAS